MNWIINNKEWLFSGLGVVIISLLLSYFFKYKGKLKASNNQNIVGDNNSQTINIDYQDNKTILKEIEKNTIDKENVKNKNLLDATLLGQYHFAYESFLMMKLDKKFNKDYEKESLNTLKNIVHKFTLPISIVYSINELSKIDNEKKLMDESTKITSSIYNYFMIDNPNYGYLYVLAVSKDTYLKLKENEFPKITLDIFKSSAQKQAENLNLPKNIVSNITDKLISYNNIIELLDKNKEEKK